MEILDHWAELGRATDSKGVNMEFKSHLRADLQILCLVHVARRYINYTFILLMYKLYIQIVYQHHEGVVYVPPGHMHQAENLQNCTKVAVDR